MSSINMESILSKVQAYTRSTAGIQKIDNVVINIMSGNKKIKSGGRHYTPEQAAQKFIEVLKKEIESAGLSTGAIAAISNLGYTQPDYIGGNSYTIGVNFLDDLNRPSLDEAKYGGINNIAALFNNGVDHTMRPVHGTWHGKETWSRTTIPGAHFIDSAVHAFMGNYAKEYNVTDIIVDNIYT